MTMSVWQSVAHTPVVMACLLLTSCSGGAPLHADTDGAAGTGVDGQPVQNESEQEERTRAIIIDLDAKQPQLFHRNLRALNRIVAEINPGEQVQLNLRVPRDGEPRSIATRTLRVDEGEIAFNSGGQSLELDASGEHCRVDAEGKRNRFRFRGRMLLTLSAAKSEQGQGGEGAGPTAVLSPNAVEATGDAAKEGVGWSELRLPLAVEIKDDHYVIVMMVEKSEDFEGDVEWHMPAYK